MKRALIITLGCVLSGCATKPRVSSEPVRPSSSNVRAVFDEVSRTVITDDGFSDYAFMDGYISAYALGAGSLGALVAVPEQYKEEKLQSAFRSGWREGGRRAFSKLSESWNHYPEKNEK